MNKGKILVGVIVLGAFLFAFNMYESKEASFKVDKTEFDVYDTKEAMFKEQQEFFPPLALAREVGVVKQLNDKVPVLKMNREITFEEAWLTELGRLMLLYSVELKETDKREDVPFLKIKNLMYETKDGQKELFKNQYNHNISYPEPMTEFKIYDHKAYRLIMLFPENFDQKINDFEKAEKFFNNVNKVSLENITLGSNRDDKEAALDPYSISIEPTSRDEVVKTIPINKTVDLPNGRKLALKKLIVGFFENRIEIDPLSDNSKLAGVYLNPLENEINHFYMQQVTKLEDGSSVVFMPPFSRLPGEYQFEVGALKYTTDKKITAKVSGSQLKQLLEHVEENEKIFLGEENGFSFYLEAGLSKNRKLQIGIESTGDISEMEVGNLVRITSLEEQERMLEGIPEEYREDFLQNRFDILLSIKDHQGEQINLFGVGQSSPSSFELMIDDDLLTDQKSITIELSKLPEIISVNKKISIPMPEQF
ncbi:hypothetical protein [Pseudalkalibacillus caeni]|uniref:DUF4179 domain-containing protein n=1 Tax=Exobacillus caeni TaxID=2574798 RepID=A0A5R9F5H1_9BACL|nr:hypothetical protein [Pseudalkalibacillus caeni]TLS36063.1 hypothetical protein FCL54_16865 [Pseudalkalibacillus caeni]